MVRTMLVVAVLGVAAPAQAGWEIEVIDIQTREKGELGVEIVALRSGKQFVVEPGARLQEGDALRFVITSSGAGFLTVLSVDGRQVATPFYPDTDPKREPAPLPLEKAGVRALPGSVVLDDAPGPEHIVVVFSTAVFDRTEVHSRIRDRLARSGPSKLTARSLGLTGKVRVTTVEKATP